MSAKWELELKELITKAAPVKKEADKLKKEYDGYAKTIKETMVDRDIMEVEAVGAVAKVSYRTSTTYDERALVEAAGAAGVKLKYKKVIDFDALERMAYDNPEVADVLLAAQRETTVPALSIKALS
jgi:hypothetical protein